jgi:N4-gp56 family major capsid protein
VGKDAYGLVPLQGENAVTPFVVNPKPSHSNKLGQEGHVGWKMYDATVILQQYFMARLECAATAVP